MASDETSPELVVLCDERGAALGTHPKATVHHADTPLHLAFSCYAFNPAAEVLVTRRAHHKRTWPGEWSNTCCGHPAPGEDLAGAVQRRGRYELGLELPSPRMAVPDFAYRAVDDNGVVENEVCPVFTVVLAHGTEPDPNPAEVAAYQWVSWAQLYRTAVQTPFLLSPWSVEQIRVLGQNAPQEALAP